jgi:hypothetical protein
MKFIGFGQVWDEVRSKVLVDFESTATQIGIIDVTDARTISILEKLGYKEYVPEIIPEIKSKKVEKETIIDNEINATIEEPVKKTKKLK